MTKTPIDWPTVSRRRALSGLAAAAGVSLLGATAARAQLTGRGADGREVDVRGNLPLRILLPNGGRYRPRRLIVLTPAGGRVATLPFVADFEGVARLPAARVPRVGFLFGAIPAAHFVRPERRIGAVYRTGDDLLVDLRRAPTAAARSVPAYLAGSIQLLTRLNQGVVELGLPKNLRYAPTAARAPGQLLRVGSAFMGQDRLLLSPPYESLFGARLF